MKNTVRLQRRIWLLIICFVSFTFFLLCWMIVLTDKLSAYKSPQKVMAMLEKGRLPLNGAWHKCNHITSLSSDKKFAWKCMLKGGRYTQNKGHTSKVHYALKHTECSLNLITPTFLMLLPLKKANTWPVLSEIKTEPISSVYFISRIVALLVYTGIIFIWYYVMEKLLENIYSLL